MFEQLAPATRAAAAAAAAIPLLITTTNAAAQSANIITPQPTAFQPVTLDLDLQLPPAQHLSETSEPNPFLDRRLNVTFVGPDNTTLTVPGFFAGDGTGPTDTSHTGDVFRAVFTPSTPGQWTYSISFREGDDIAIDTNPNAGSPGPGNNLNGSFNVAPPDPQAPGFLAKGKLRYTGQFYLRFDDGTPFVKSGADSPENILGYEGFDNTPNASLDFETHGTGPQAFDPDNPDWKPGDPDWDRTDPPGTNNGRAIIGALNYLHDNGVNSIYFLPMNIGGDARDTWPYIGPIDRNGSNSNDNTRFDISKLAQWDIVFNHAQSLGIHLHFVLNEAEAPNKRELDDATLGVERKLFYRELIARFGYHNSIQWNISEEYNLVLDLGPQRVIEFADYIKSIDPYDTPTTVHNSGNATPNGPWSPFIGQPQFDLTSLQQARKADGWDDLIADFRQAVADSGRIIHIAIDEPASPTRDVDDFNDFRKRVIWDVLLSGAGGEWFINNRDQSLNDFREFEQTWNEAASARQFIEANIDVLTASPDKSLVTGEDSTFGGAPVLAIPGETYLIYFPNASDTGALDLSAHGGPFELTWYNPRNGQFEGNSVTLTGDTIEPLPAPPAQPNQDWAARVRFTGIADCNNNTIPDANEIANNPALDCDGNGILDECQTDCDNNGIADTCEIIDDPSLDCDNNQQLDRCQTDSDNDGVIDPCEPDCNNNRIPDDTELAAAGGLAAAFFPNKDLDGEPILTRIDPTVDFAWGSEGPGDPVDGNLFSSRWTGYVLTNEAGSYLFSTTTNDGTRLFIDGELIIDVFEQQTATEFTASVDLPANTFIPVAFEHFQNGGTAVAELRWQPPAGTKTIIPTSNLRPAIDLNDDDVPDLCAPPCPADTNANGEIDSADLLTVLVNVGLADDATTQQGDVAPPTNPDGVVNAGDLLAVIDRFGQTCD